MSLAILFACSDDDVSLDSPFNQEVVENPVTPPSVDVSFDQTEISLSEGGDGVTVTLNLAAAAPAGGTITVAVIPDSTTAATADYETNIVGDITISEGDESKEFSISAVDDSEQEDDEVVYFSVTSDVEILGLTSTILKVTISSNEVLETLLIVQENGDVFSIDPADGDSTNLFKLMTSDFIDLNTDDIPYDDRRRSIEEDLTPVEDATAMIYDAESATTYVSAAADIFLDGELDDNAEAVIYKVDLNSGLSEKFSRPPVYWETSTEQTGWYSISDFLVGTFEIFISGYVYDAPVGAEDEPIYIEDELVLAEQIAFEPIKALAIEAIPIGPFRFDGYGILAIDKSDGAAGGISVPDLGGAHGGLARGSETDSVYYGRSTVSGPGYIYKASLAGDPQTAYGREIELSTEDAAAFGDGFDIGASYIESFAESTTGAVFGLLLDQSSGNKYLVDVSLETGMIEYISTVSLSTDDFNKSGLAIIPTAAL